MATLTPLEDFAAWLRREMPAGTVISNPDWWAPRILRRAQLHQPAPSGQQDNPGGWKLVPIEPTPDMIAAMAVCESSGKINKQPTIGMSGAVEAYEAMLAAAPELATAGEPVSPSISERADALTKRAFFDAWWTLQTSKGDPMRNHNLTQDAFQAGYEIGRAATPVGAPLPRHEKKEPT